MSRARGGPAPENSSHRAVPAAGRAAHDPEAKVTPETRTHRRTPAGRSLHALRLRFRVAVTLAALGAAAAIAQVGGSFNAHGSLTIGDPTYGRAYLNDDGSCSLSSIGTAVHYDVFELVVGVEGGVTDIAANLCTGTDFDSVLYFYQSPGGRPGAFDATAPCARLVAYDDDACGPASAVGRDDLARGVLTIVVTSFANGTTGDYGLAAVSETTYLKKFLFYSGFETGDLRTWSKGQP